MTFDLTARLARTETQDYRHVRAQIGKLWTQYQAERWTDKAKADATFARLRHFERQVRMFQERG